MASDERDLSKYDKGVLNRVFNPNLPYSELEEEELNQETPEEERWEIKEAKRLELEGVKAAEAGDVAKAIEWFDRAIRVAPDHASAYNNCAQALRLKGEVNGALENLNKALELSEGKGKAARQAYTQRAAIRRLQGDDEAALEDFKKAAELGGVFAKQQVVNMNPYAALCNQMLGEVFAKLKSGEQ